MTTALQQAGSQGAKQTRYAPIWTNRFWTGLWTQRNPLRDAATPYLYEKFYSGSRYDSLIGGLNTELSTRLTLVRSPGSSVYNSSTFPAINDFYEFRQFSANGGEIISVIVDTASVVYDGTGPTTKVAIFNKSNGSGQTYFQSVGNVLYFGDGVDQEKYLQINGVWTTQLWGIAIGSINTSVPEYAGTGTNVAASGSVTSWANPGNITGAPDAAYATATITPGSSTQNTGIKSPTTVTQTSTGLLAWNNVNGVKLLGGTAAFVAVTAGIHTPVTGTSENIHTGGYAANVPSNATIKGIVVTVYRNSAGSGGQASDGAVQLLKSGTPVGSNKGSASAWPGTSTSTTYGSSSDLWGTTWTPSQVNASGFGVTFQALVVANIGSTEDADVDYIAVTVYYAVPSGNLYSDLLQGTAYGYSIPVGNLIKGISVVIKGFQTGSGGSLTVQLLKNGAVTGTAKTGVQLPGSNNFITLGSASDLWGTTWYPADINSATFGVSIQAIDQSLTAQSWSVDDVQIVIATFGAPSVTTAGGSLTLVTGYTWVYAYYNANAGTVSTASQPFSYSTPGSSLEFKFAVVASTDPQVTNIMVFRTDDGGAILFQLPQIYSNTNQTITDNFADSTLNTFSQAPINHSNDPPPTGIGILTYHLGRVWGAVGNVVYYSQASLGAVPGVAAESWPPLNNFVFPSLVNRLFPCAIGLLVFTTSDIYLIPNTQTDPFFGQPYPYAKGIGLLSFNAFSVNGTTVYLMTSDSQVIAFDPSSGISEVGFPIGDIFENSYNPSNAYLTWHVSGSRDKALYAADGAIGWYRMCPISAPENGLTWSPQRQIVGGTSAVKSVEVVPGIHSLLIGPSASGPILQRDYSTYSDNGSTYSAFATLGSIVLAHPGQTAAVDFITTDCTTPGSRVAVSVLLDDIFGTFESLKNPTSATDPPQLPASTSLDVNRWYMTTSQTPAECRHLQIMFAWPSESFANELLTYTIFGAHIQEK